MHRDKSEHPKSSRICADSSQPLAAEDLAEQIVIRCLRLRQGAFIPSYQTVGSVGLDLCACPEDGLAIRMDPGCRVLCPTGLAFAIPAGFEGQVRPRSGWAFKHGVTVLNSPGTLDSDYRGEVKILLINLGQEAITIQPGDRIAQLVIAPVTRVVLREVSVLDETIRGAGGFGHTGKGLGE